LREHPFDAGTFPGDDFGFEALSSADPAVEALMAEDGDFDLDHIRSARVLEHSGISSRARTI
jgi:hypothetical protein